ncbi:hypothetical protein [Bradyrhizobium sp. 142]|uniref:hypothetical protein n=1 Tax=unclassified Bradyrhizobium TaxID=2631580 RepID=UPI001FFA022F|nr:hypothetical protein [Bradyrhizobium sp. 142]MCK1708499.1 hypothetical protein [Bradyrhizobium sp. 143]MCK1729242.1 hypothetical protein [Bradyrhizobium sp. 142]
MGFEAGRIGLAAACAAMTWLAAQAAHAANGAYAVDAADISEVGSCKVESWMSAATNTDFSAVANPSCVVDPFRPIELSLNTNRARSDGDWSTTVAPKAKTNFVPTGIGRWGLSAYAGGSFDAATGENLSAFAVIPATFRLSETMRVNINGGWLWDRTVDRHYLTYGISFDWKFTDTLQWTIEGYGQAGASEIASVVQPRFQSGVRYRPNEIFSIDLIYGRNITGANSNWITLGTTIRFPAPGAQPEHRRTGHL